MAFFGYCLQYMLKINLGLAIVCMINNTAVYQLQQSQVNNSLEIANISSFIQLLHQNSSNANQTSVETHDTCLFKVQHGKSVVS